MEVLEGIESEKSLNVPEGSEAKGKVSGGRVSNTWVICLKEGNNCAKGQLIPHNVRSLVRPKERPSGRFEMSLRPIS